MNHLVVATSDINLQSKALEIAAELQVPCVSAPGSENDFCLWVSDQGLSLQALKFPEFKPLQIDFTSAQLSQRGAQHSTSKESVARACGLKKGWRPRILDATAGLGRDAFILAKLGCEVVMCERSKILAILLADALDRLKISEPEIPLQLIALDAKAYLEKNPEPFDVIYLDPMFPVRHKSALVKKEMRILKACVGEDLDADTLFTVALTKAKFRVVVKRPKGAEPLGDRIPSFVTEGVRNRFDVYLVGRT